MGWAWITKGRGYLLLGLTFIWMDVRPTPRRTALITLLASPLAIHTPVMQEQSLVHRPGSCFVGVSQTHQGPAYTGCPAPDKHALGSARAIPREARKKLETHLV
ncbi:hypothetical protein BCV70DRAFT_9055 [Testicularia cyperi]|uniref:Uncharacterized protein n=1 Tax=Testicularia cyperi TaxID=1882483 RepID=A0A317XYI3_9BASI|nr:hypothetical protein BCV70DRAFT_9055 [Testicularia cyperi]